MTCITVTCMCEVYNFHRLPHNLQNFATKALRSALAKLTGGLMHSPIDLEIS